MLKYCALALLALFCVLIMRSSKSEFAGFASLASSIILMGAALASFSPILEYLNTLSCSTPFSEYNTILLKAMGITLAVQFAAEICRDSGESALASKLELIGKAEILLLCLPLAKELVSLAMKITEA